MIPPMSNDSFFRQIGDGYEPNPVCRGPWGPETLHGRVVAGLLAREAEKNWGAEGFRVGRMTVDLYRMPIFAPVEVSSKIVRESRRIKVVDTEFMNGGKSAGRASVVFLKESESPEGYIWGPPAWTVPPPDSVEPAVSADGDRPQMWETRRIDPDSTAKGPKRCWISEIHGLVEGEELTPLQRVALAADFASPFSNADDQGLQWLNADITLYLNRYPSTRWVGFETNGHQSADGISVAECSLYDESGAIGRSAVVAIANKRPD